MHVWLQKLLGHASRPFHPQHSKRIYRPTNNHPPSVRANGLRHIPPANERCDLVIAMPPRGTRPPAISVTSNVGRSPASGVYMVYCTLATLPATDPRSLTIRQLNENPTPEGSLKRRQKLRFALTYPPGTWTAIMTGLGK